MPIQNGSYQPRSGDAIANDLIDDLEDRFDDASVEVGDVIKAHLETIADSLATNQEQALQTVYEAAYLADATGQELDKLVRIIGLTRREAVPASGVLTFTRDSPPQNDYVIPSGTVAETEGSSPIQFETTQSGTLTHVDGFEDGNVNGWSGDTGSVSVTQQPFAIDDYALELPATDGVTITQSGVDLGRGTTFDAMVYNNANTSLSLLFCLQDADSYLGATVDANADELLIEVVENGTTTDTYSESVTIPTGERNHLEVDTDVTDEITVTLYDSADKDTEIGSVTATESTHQSGGVGVRSNDDTSAKYVDRIATTAITVNAAAVEGGERTNVGDDTVIVMPSPPTGVSSVRNPIPMGDTSFTDTSDSPFTVGLDREEDDELRQRALDSTSLGGSATVTAIAAELEAIDEVRSVTVFTNRTSQDNTGSGGLPPHSFEAVVYGGSNEEVANALFGTMGATAHDYGGAHGSAQSYTVTSDVLESDVTVNWSRPSELTVDVTADVVVDETYIGDEQLKSRIVNYVGGTDIDGSTVPGLTVGEDIYVGVLNDVVVGPEDTGVYDASFTIDSSGDGNDDTSTTAEGADVLSVGDSEVATTNGRDGSITINSTSL